jgi:hypothetical protein
MISIQDFPYFIFQAIDEIPGFFKAFGLRENADDGFGVGGPDVQPGIEKIDFYTVGGGDILLVFIPLF